MRDHQHLAGRGVGGYAGDEPVGVKLRGEREAFLDIGSRGAHQVARDTSERNRVCSAGFSRKLPVNWFVTVVTPGLRTPRIDMHICSASSITATPRGLRISSMAPTICEVRCSWLCRRRA